MPFGLTNAPATFMRLMDDILRPFTNSFVVVYLDNILIFSQSWEEHLHHIRQVLQTLWQHKLCANLEKCTFGMTQVQYLGYIIDEQGVHVDPAKIQVIRDWPSPTTLTELRSFLGLANFYRRPVDNGSITFLGRKRSSTQTTEPCSTLSDTVRKYPTYDKEMYSIM
eukprot:PITA_09880